jgi:cell division protease FtsH
MGRDMGHGRDYSEDVAAVVDAEVRTLVENAHHEAWEILVEYRHVLDDMVLKLLDKETLGKEEVAEIFAPVVKRPARDHPTGNGRRPLSTKPPVLTPAELALLGPADVAELEDMARGRKGSQMSAGAPKRTPRRRTVLGRAVEAATGGSSSAAGVPDEASEDARSRASANRTAQAPDGAGGATARSAEPVRPDAPRRRRATGTDPAS